MTLCKGAFATTMATPEKSVAQKLTFAQVFVKTATVVISCCCFADNGRDFNSARAARTLNSVLECVLHVQHAYFSSFNPNQILHLWCCR